MVKTIGRVVKHIMVQSVITDCRDADDNKFLALALDSAAKFIVTGDRDLLELHPWRGVQVLTSGDFVRAMQGIRSDRVINAINAITAINFHDTGF